MNMLTTSNELPTREFKDLFGNPRKCETCTNFNPTKRDPKGNFQGECRANPPTTTMFLLQPPAQQQSLMIGGKQQGISQQPMQIQTTFYPLVNGNDPGCSHHNMYNKSFE